MVKIVKCIQRGEVIRTAREPNLFVGLEESTEGGVRLIACDEDGVPKQLGQIITIKRDGMIMRHLGVNPKLGFPLDEHGRVEIK